MKNILLNIIIFILITAGTAVCVVCANIGSITNPVPQTNLEQTGGKKNENPEENEEEPPEETDPLSEAMFGMLQKIISAKSFSGNYRLKSSDGSTSISGNIELQNSQPSSTIDSFDIASLSFSVQLKGKIEGVNIDSIIVFKNKRLFLTVGNIHISSTLDELGEVFAIISDTFALPNIESIFDLENLNSSLESATLTENESSKIFSITLPLIGPLAVYMDTNNNPNSAHLSNISFGGKKFECSVFLSRDTNNSISLENESMYIPLGNASDLISTLAKTYTALPLAYSGTFATPDFSGTVNISISKSGTIAVNLGMNKFSVYLYIDKDTAYLYCMGLKIFDTTANVMSFVNERFGSDILGMIKVQSIGAGNIIINDESSLAYEKTIDGILKSLYASFGSLNLQLSKTTYVGISSSPNTAGALTVRDLGEMLENFEKFLPKKSAGISFDITAYLGSFSFGGSGYAELSDLSLDKLFLSGKLGGKSLKAYSISNNFYLDFDSLKLKMEKSDTESFVALIKKYLGFDGFVASDLFTMLSTSISGISVLNKNDILITFSSGVRLKLSCFESKLYVDATNFSVGGKSLDLYLTLHQDGNKNRSIGDGFDASSFSSVGDASGFTQSLINTLTAKQTTFEGEIDISLWFVTIKKISLKVETFFENGKFKVEVTIDKLPTLAIITTLNCIKYKNQYVKLVIEDGRVNISRYARLRFKNSEELKYEKSINMKDFSLDILMDTFGFDDTVKKRLKDASLPSSVGSLFGEQAVSFVDSSLVANIKASELHKKLSNANFEVKHDGNFVSDINLTVDYGKLIHIKANLIRK